MCVSSSPSKAVALDAFVADERGWATTAARHAPKPGPDLRDEAQDLFRAIAKGTI